ncbi:MAG: hypothetical protein LBJ47_05385 [Tannerella sp.]|jgi:hypothetical protein|nr:hypothetical protein [Tannerella sp.]
MMKPLLFFTLLTLVAGCASVAPSVRRSATAEASEAPVWTENLRSGSVKNSYRVTLQTPENRITGLCILKKSGEEWRGTLVNEMGAKAFDFVVKGDRCELLNVLPAMDKWYVKKTVAADLYFLFSVDSPGATFRRRTERFVQDGSLVVNYRKKQLLVTPDGAVRLTNSRRNLRYELRVIND